MKHILNYWNKIDIIQFVFLGDVSILANSYSKGTWAGGCTATTESKFQSEPGQVPTGTHSKVCMPWSVLPHPEYDFIPVPRQVAGDKGSSNQGSLISYMLRVTRPLGLTIFSSMLVPPNQTPTNEDWGSKGPRQKTSSVSQSQAVATVTCSTNTRFTAVQQMKAKQKVLAAAHATTAPLQGII